MILGFVHQVQLWVFIKAVGTGYFLAIFGVLMLINASGGKNTFFVFCRDILFFTVSAIISFMFMLKYCSGLIRFYVLAGEFMGFILFYFFPGMSLAQRFRVKLSAIRAGSNKIRKKRKKLQKNT